MKRITHIILFLLSAACFAGCVKADENELSPMLQIVEDETGTPIFTQSAPIKADRELDGTTSLVIRYRNGYGREVKVNLNASNGELKTDEAFVLAEGAEENELTLPLYGMITELGDFSLGLTFKVRGESPISTTLNLFAEDPLDPISFTWGEAVLVDEIYNGIENNTFLKIPYVNGYGREVTCKITSECGLSGEAVLQLNGNYDEVQNGEPGIVEIPLSGNPSVFGKKNVHVLIESIGVKAESDVEIDITENTGKFDLPEFSTEITVSGDLYKNVPVGERNDVKLTIPYKKGFGNHVLVSVTEQDGLFCAEHETVLNDGAGDAVLEIALAGTPHVLGAQTLSGSVKLKDSGEEIFTFSKEVTVLSPGELIVETAMLKDAVFAGIPAETTLDIKYKDGYDRKAAVAVEFPDAAKSGLTITAVPEVQLEKSGIISLAVTGTPAAGFYSGKVTVTPEQEAAVSCDFAFEVRAEMPALQLLLKRSIIAGTPLVLNAPCTDSKLRIFFHNGFGRKLESVSVNGLVNATAQQLELSGEDGYVDVPVTGTPASQLGDVTVEVKVAGGETLNQTLSLYAGSKVTYKDLDYYEVFYDNNGNGTVEAGEVWLDRNLGATSNDTGKHGAFNVPMESVGKFWYWGRPYDENSPIIEKDGKKQPERKDEWNVVPEKADPKRVWNICPEGYRLPTENEWRHMFNGMMGTNFQDAPKGPRVIDFKEKTYGVGLADLIKTPLHFVMSGIHDNFVENDIGTLSCYWCSSWFNAGAEGGWVPVRIITGGDATQGKANIGPAKSKSTTATVRCVKSL